MEAMDVNIIAEQVSSWATVAGASAWAFSANFLILIVLTLVLLVFAMRAGSSGLVALNLSLYGGYGVYIVFPWRADFIALGGTPLIQAVLAVILFAFATAGPFVIASRLTSQSFGMLSIIQNLLLSLGASLFIMALAYHVFEIDKIFTFPAPLNELFEPQGYFFYWFIAPLLGLFFLAR